MKYRCVLPLTDRSKSEYPNGWLVEAVVGDSATLIDRKYPHLDYLEMYGPPTPPEVEAEREALKKRMLEVASMYITEDERMGPKPWNVTDLLCIEFDLETGKAVLLKHRPVTTPTGFVYAEWYDPETDK